MNLEPKLFHNVGNHTPIYTQQTGESFDYDKLSPVSKKRLNAMMQIYLDYILSTLGEMEPDEEVRSSIFAAMIWKSDSDTVTK
jgi:hypothetical protein